MKYGTAVRIAFRHETTVELGYNDLGCSDTLAIASNIEWY
jgi:hypothetical protein